MSKRHTEMLSRIGLAGAIVPTYLERVPEPTPEVKTAISKVEFYVTKAIRLYGKVGKENLEKIGAKIDRMRAETCLGKARSILTFIDYAVELLERALNGDKPIAYIGGSVGVKAIKELVFALLDLRVAIAKGEYLICQRAGKKAADVWEKTNVNCTVEY